MSSDAAFVSRWQASADQCLSAVPADLTEEQRSVFPSCTSMMQRLQLGSALVPCAQAHDMLFGECSLMSLVSTSTVLDSCLLEEQQLNQLSERWWLDYSLDCHEMVEAATGTVWCMLRAEYNRLAVYADSLASLREDLSQLPYSDGLLARLQGLRTWDDEFDIWDLGFNILDLR